MLTCATICYAAQFGLEALKHNITLSYENWDCSQVSLLPISADVEEQQNAVSFQHFSFVQRSFLLQWTVHCTGLEILLAVIQIF